MQSLSKHWSMHCPGWSGLLGYCGSVLERGAEIEGEGKMEKKQKDCASEEMFVWLVVFPVASVYVDTQIPVTIQYGHLSGSAGAFS